MVSSFVNNRFHCACVLLVSIFFGFWSTSDDEADAPSSVWCNEHSDGLQCSFQNLYYHPDEEQFIFHLTPDSIVSGLHHPSQLNRIQTSTVANHSEFYLKVEIRSNLSSIGARDVERPMFLLGRFKPDNIHHVIHDDLLPLHATYSRLCFGNVERCARDYQLALIDTHPRGRFFEWYAHFSKMSPLVFSELRREWFKFCDVKIGLMNKIVYQYGIGRDHGSLKSELRGREILDFREYILRKFTVQKQATGVTVVRRRHTRRILNENYLIRVVESKFRLRGGFKTNIIDLLSNKSSEVIRAVSSSELLLVMHGAESILALFLPFNSSVIEMFPFGIDYKFVSPLFGYSRIKDVQFRYYPWTNTNESLTVTHPDNPILLGGIRHLAETYQREIEQTKTVPPVTCCYNPSYLFRMFQDTLVDHSVEPVIAQAVDSIRRRIEETNTTWFVPGQVRNFTCHVGESGIVLSWSPPKNVVGLNEAAHFDIVLTIDGRSEVIRTNFHNLTLDISKLSEARKAQAWICCIVTNVKGRDSYTECDDINKAF